MTIKKCIDCGIHSDLMNPFVALVALGDTYFICSEHLYGEA